MPLSVIVSTYNSPESLHKTLASLACQTFPDFEVLIADDGSGPETVAAIEQIQAETQLNIRHLWHEDLGFRKNTILNKAVQASRNPYLVFLDGDCIARADLIATHLSHAKPGRVLTCGSQIDLPRQLHSELTPDAIAAGRPFDPKWLAARGVQFPLLRSDKRIRLRCRQPWSRMLDAMLPRSGGFVGCNSSVWKADILKVNGFDESITYGVDDKDLAIRLMNAGVQSRRLKYSLVYVHLEHQRAYADRAAIERNRRLVVRRRQERVTWIDLGIDKSRAAA